MGWKRDTTFLKIGQKDSDKGEEKGPDYFHRITGRSLDIFEMRAGGSLNICYFVVGVRLWGVLI